MSESDSKLTLLDACAVINLYATGHFAEIVACIDGRVAIASIVEQESLYIASHDDFREREIIELANVVEAGLIEIVSPGTDVEYYRFLDLAVELDDGEAMTLALATHRNGSVVTDDRKAIRVATDLVETVPSLAFINTWFESDAIDKATQRDVLLALQTRASYIPGRNHSYRDWWDRILEQG